VPSTGSREQAHRGRERTFAVKSDTSNAARERGRIVLQGAEPTDARRFLPDEALVAEIHSLSGRCGLAGTAHDQPGVADGGRMNCSVACHQRQRDQGLSPGAERHLGKHARLVWLLDPLESEQVTSTGVSDRRGQDHGCRLNRLDTIHILKSGRERPDQLPGRLGKR
jgi:hypothetical protein